MSTYYEEKQEKRAKAQAAVIAAVAPLEIVDEGRWQMPIKDNGIRCGYFRTEIDWDGTIVYHLESRRILGRSNRRRYTKQSSIIKAIKQFCYAETDGEAVLKRLRNELDNWQCASWRCERVAQRLLRDNDMYNAESIADEIAEHPTMARHYMDVFRRAAFWKRVSKRYKSWIEHRKIKPLREQIGFAREALKREEATRNG